jgi:acetyltransferase-like isoleucine patch superfamily enzyme
MIKNKYQRSPRFLFKSLLGYLAYVAVFPMWLCPFLHRLRGVKIHSVRNVYIAPMVLIDSLFPELVTIEEDVYLTRGVKVIAHFNPTNALKKILETDEVRGPITFRKGAFVGVGSIILPDVTVGTCAVVGAGSVVTRDVPDYAFVAGNPARIMGDIRDRKGALRLF